jgi:hypothetical protein
LVQRANQVEFFWPRGDGAQTTGKFQLRRVDFSDLEFHLIDLGFWFAEVSPLPERSDLCEHPHFVLTFSLYQLFCKEQKP